MSKEMKNGELYFRSMCVPANSNSMKDHHHQLKRNVKKKKWWVSIQEEEDDQIIVEGVVRARK